MSIGPRTHPRIIINSVPKSGTHLVERALQLMGVSARPPLFLSSADTSWFAAEGGEATVPIGVGMPVMASVAKLRARLETLPEGQVVTGHVPYSPDMASLLEELGYRMLLALRDPRDIAVSLAHHIATQPGHRLHQRFQAMTPDERLMATICGMEGLLSLDRRMAAVLPWRGERFALAVEFEELVGSRGGGDDAKQMRCLQMICAHLGMAEVDLKATARDLFGQSATFRRGMIGQWRTAFTAAHHAAFASHVSLL